MLICLAQTLGVLFCVRVRRLGSGSALRKPSELSESANQQEDSYHLVSTKRTVVRTTMFCQASKASEQLGCAAGALHRE